MSKLSFFFFCFSGWSMHVYLHGERGGGRVHIPQIRLCLVSNLSAVSEKRTDLPLNQQLNCNEETFLKLEEIY